MTQTRSWLHSWGKCLAVAMLIWGNAALASAPDASEHQDLQTISSWMAHLNHYYPQLEVAVQEDLSNPEARANTLNELDALENFMAGEAALPNSALKTIACTKPVCDGGGGGKCSACAIE